MPGFVIDAVATFILSISLVVGLRHLTITFGLVDRPDSVRKRHKGAVPLCGGMAVFAAFALASFAGQEWQVLGLNFWLALLIILSLGVVDDRHPLPAGGRLVMQIAMAVALIGGTDIEALSVGSLLSASGHLFLPLFFVVGVLFVTGLVNAWNMVDGVDGLAGGTALVAVVWLMLVANFADMTELVAPLLALAMSVCGFLIFNMRSPWRVRASIFLGDAGSTALGATIAYMIIILSTESMAVSFPALLWVVILPVTDTLSLIARRLIAGRSPMSGDRWHLHHLLIDYGLSPAATTNALLIVSAICGGIGYLGILGGVDGESMAAGLLIPISLHTGFVLLATGAASRLWVNRRLAARGMGVADPIRSLPVTSYRPRASASSLKDE